MSGSPDFKFVARDFLDPQNVDPQSPEYRLPVQGVWPQRIGRSIAWWRMWLVARLVGDWPVAARSDFRMLA